ncbi:MAG: (4Fe-4S)-binding protein [Streptococcaceae bacterium]|nr:(4Fe-4S)-binding protein [Streptococcaceae bacterium]
MDANKFNGETVTDELLKENGYRAYKGTEQPIDIYYNIKTCTHAGECVRGNRDVFEVGRRPWIIPDNGQVDQVIEVLNRCPSGALKYIRKD